MLALTWESKHDARGQRGCRGCTGAGVILAPIAARAVRGAHEPLLQNGTPRHIFPWTGGWRTPVADARDTNWIHQGVDAPQEIASVLSSGDDKAALPRPDLEAGKSMKGPCASSWPTLARRLRSGADIHRISRMRMTR